MSILIGGLLLAVAILILNYFSEGFLVLVMVKFINIHCIH